MITPELVVGPGGSLRADGGRGAEGETLQGFDHVACSPSGGGSGGMWVVQALRIDLSSASPDALTARGGVGFACNQAGGDGGPGLIQLHVPEPSADVILAPGVSLDDLSAPNAHVLLPFAL